MAEVKKSNSVMGQWHDLRSCKLVLSMNTALFNQKLIMRYANDVFLHNFKWNASCGKATESTAGGTEFTSNQHLDSNTTMQNVNSERVEGSVGEKRKAFCIDEDSGANTITDANDASLAISDPEHEHDLSLWGTPLSDILCLSPASLNTTTVESAEAASSSSDSTKYKSDATSERMDKNGTDETTLPLTSHSSSFLWPEDMCLSSKQVELNIRHSLISGIPTAMYAVMLRKSDRQPMCAHIQCNSVPGLIPDIDESSSTSASARSSGSITVNRSANIELPKGTQGSPPCPDPNGNLWCVLTIHSSSQIGCASQYGYGYGYGTLLNWKAHPGAVQAFKRSYETIETKYGVGEANRAALAKLVREKRQVAERVDDTAQSDMIIAQEDIVQHTRGQNDKEIKTEVPPSLVITAPPRTDALSEPQVITPTSTSRATSKSATTALIKANALARATAMLEGNSGSDVQHVSHYTAVQLNSSSNTPGIRHIPENSSTTTTSVSPGAKYLKGEQHTVDYGDAAATCDDPCPPRHVMFGMGSVLGYNIG